MQRRAVWLIASLLALSACTATTAHTADLRAHVTRHAAAEHAVAVAPPLSIRPTRSAPTARRVVAHERTPDIAHERVVAYYGVPNNPQLGVLGAGSPDDIAQQVTRRAASFRGYGEPVVPALELIATVAQGSPGRDRTYSTPIPADTIRRYLDAVHRRHMLLILDLQPGRATFLSQARALRPFLLDPSVQLALDPEWKVTRGAPGGGRIGSSTAAGINDVGAYLSSLVRTHRLPRKMLLIHQFTRSMLPDRNDITQHPDVRLVLHADGFGTQAAKIKVFHGLAFPHPAFGVGFKLFLHHDIRMMTPAQVMALTPRPDVITYQ